MQWRLHLSLMAWGLGYYDTDNSAFFSKEAMVVTALCSYGTWLVVVTGWSLLIGVIIIEFTHRN